MDNILEDDENNVYNKILEMLRPGSRWGDKEDKAYQNRTINSWDRQREKLTKYILQDKSFQRRAVAKKLPEEKIQPRKE